MPTFTPGTLSAPQTAALNELQQMLVQWRNFAVAAPLALTRNGNSIQLRTDPALITLLGVVMSHEGSATPVHTVKQLTRDETNAVVDYFPEQLFDQVLSPDSSVIPDGTLVAFFPIPDWKDWYWAIPATGPADDTCGWIAGMRPDDCLTLSVESASGACVGIDTDQVLHLNWDGDSWNSDPDVFVYDTGDGFADFSVVNGEPKLTIDGIYGVPLSCGTDPNTIDFAFGGTTLCDGLATPCGDNTFVVRLTCTTEGECCDADILDVTVMADPTSGDAPLSVDFDSTVTGGVPPYVYFWDFMDGSYSSEEDPTHTFTTAGTYNVALTVSDACDTISITGIVTVTVGGCQDSCASAPAEPPSDNLVTWLRPDALVAGALASWPDSSASANDATQGTAGNKPTVIAASINGLPAVDFDGVDDFMEMTNSWPAGDITIVAVVRPDTVTADTIIGSDAFGTQLRLGAGQTQLLQTDITVLGTGTLVRTGGNWYVIAVRYASPNATFFAGVCQDGTGTGAGPRNAVQSYLGMIDNPGGGGHTEWWDGLIAEVLVYDADIGAVATNNAICYAKGKYGL